MSINKPSALRYIADQISLGRVTTPQYVVSVLREAIVTGVITSTKTLPQDQIASELGISKIPVREALRELEGQGLVNFIPNRGFVVTETSYEEMIECFKLRRMLETFAVGESVPITMEQDLDHVESLIDGFETTTDIMLSSHRNLTLHLAFYKAARMSHLEQMIIRAHTVAQRYTHIYMQLNKVEIEPQDEHRGILNAYRENDVELAVALMDSHIAVACERFAYFLKDHLPSAELVT